MSGPVPCLRKLTRQLQQLRRVAASHAERLGVATDTTVELLRTAGTFLRDREEYGSAREVFEREYLLAQVTRFGGNISRTATFVGMERSALHRKLKALGVG